MRSLLKTFLFVIAATPLFAQKADTLRATIDLKNVANDKVKVSLTVPPLSFKNAVYVLPMTIPGTYDRQDFIRFIEDVRAYDRNGKALKVEREKDKQIRIPASQQLHRLEYYVNDSFDDSDTKAYIFPPSGTNIQRDTNFLINHSGFIGYFEKVNLPYEVKVLKPAHFFGATSLFKFTTNDTTDVLKAANYVTLVDNPVMYSRPDTMSYMQGNTRITIAVNQGDSHISAQRISQLVRPRTEAIERFLGTMPVDRYTFIFYFQNENSSVSRVHGYGALEHNYSSVYFLPSFKDSSMLDEFVGSTVVHEFLHILVPLNLHSEEIAYFNYRAPEMSQHLWLYEGVTEYFSMLAQAQGGVSSEDDFLNEVSRKISSTEALKEPLSLTTLSRRVLEPEYQELYTIIYEKGAVGAMLLDIRLRELSGGEITLLKLVKKLGEMYGPARPFKDEELIATITKATYPEIGEFFKNYIVGDAPLPYSEYFSKMGWIFERNRKVTELDFGELNIAVGMNEKTPIIRFTNTNGDDNLFNVKKGDTLLKVNGIETASSAEESWNSLNDVLFKPKEARETTIEVKRGNEILVLKATPESRERTIPFVLFKNENPTVEQLAFKGRFLKNDGK